MNWESWGSGCGRAVRLLALCTAVAAMPAWTGGVAEAGKPGGGGGGAPPPGTIWYRDLSGAAAGSTGVTWTVVGMDGNGGNRLTYTRTSLPRASRMAHGGYRWFLSREDVPGEGAPGPFTTRRDLYAVRSDGGLRVRLTSEPTIDYGGVFDWAPDEGSTGATIGVFARQWTGMGDDDTVVPGSWGLYTARVAFDASGNVVGLEAPPTFTLFLGTRGTTGNESPDPNSFCWSPDMARLAVSNPSGALQVVDVSTGTSTSLGEGYDPDWSPDGSRIVCTRTLRGSSPSRDQSVVESMTPAGADRTVLYSVRSRVGAGTSQYNAYPKWSPDGAYVAFNYVYAQNGSSWTHSIYRVTSTGSGAVNLTPEVVDPAAGDAIVDWR